MFLGFLDLALSLVQIKRGRTCEAHFCSQHFLAVAVSGWCKVQ